MSIKIDMSFRTIYEAADYFDYIKSHHYNINIKNTNNSRNYINLSNGIRDYRKFCSELLDLRENVYTNFDLHKYTSSVVQAIDQEIAELQKKVTLMLEVLSNIVLDRHQKCIIQKIIREIKKYSKFNTYTNYLFYIKEKRYIPVVLVQFLVNHKFADSYQSDIFINLLFKNNNKFLNIFFDSQYPNEYEPIPLDIEYLRKFLQS